MQPWGGGQRLKLPAFTFVPWTYGSSVMACAGERLLRLLVAYGARESNEILLYSVSKSEDTQYRKHLPKSESSVAVVSCNHRWSPQSVPKNDV